MKPFIYNNTFDRNSIRINQLQRGFFGTSLHKGHQLQASEEMTVYKIIGIIANKQKFQPFFEQNLQNSK